MLAPNERLSYLIRKNYGRFKLDDLKKFFKGFNLKKLNYIELAEADKIIRDIKNIFSEINVQSEIIDNNPSVSSFLIKQISEQVKPDDTCYIYANNAEICGMFTATTQSALKNCLSIVFLADVYDNDCYIVDTQLRFWVLINYYNDDDRYDPNRFEIRLKQIQE